MKFKKDYKFLSGFKVLENPLELIARISFFTTHLLMGINNIFMRQKRRKKIHLEGGGDDGKRKQTLQTYYCKSNFALGIAEICQNHSSRCI